MRQHSADLIEAAWAPLGRPSIDFKEGLARGTFIMPVRNVKTWTQRPNGVGGVLHLYTADRSGTLTLLIDIESAVHQQLVTLANLDVALRSIVGPLVIRDANTKEVSFYNKARIETEPDTPKGTAAGVVPWRFLFETYLRQSLTTTANVVGN